MDKIENDYIPYWDPLKNKITWISKEECKKIQETFNKPDNECPNFEAREQK